MRSLSLASIIEKNKLATASSWLLLLDIFFDAETVRLVNNNEDIIFDGNTYLAFPFEPDSIEDSGKGEIPKIVIKVSNVTREIQTYLEAGDGGLGMGVSLKVINTDTTDNLEADIELNFVVDSVRYDEKVVTFSLTGGNCLTRRVPRRRYIKEFCFFEYGGKECGVSAATQVTYPACNRTYANCKQRNNNARFGGFKWIPKL